MQNLREQLWLNMAADHLTTILFIIVTINQLLIGSMSLESLIQARLSSISNFLLNVFSYSKTNCQPQQLKLLQVETFMTLRKFII